MIHPRAEITDLDPVGWGRLCEAMFWARYSNDWVYVLHSRGRVLSVARWGMNMPGYREPVTDPAALASRIRSETGASRVVVIDQDGLGELVSNAVTRARPELTLQQMRAEVDGVYWSSSAVATDPAPPRDPWPDIRRELACLGQRLNGLLVLEEDGRAALAILATIEDGLVTRVRCLDASSLDLEALARSRAGDLDLALRLEWSDFISAMSAPDTLDRLAGLIETAPRRHGLERAPSLLRRAGRGESEDSPESGMTVVANPLLHGTGRGEGESGQHG